MPSPPNKPLVHDHIARGEKAHTQKQHGVAVHKAGTHSQSEHDAVEKSSTAVHRQSHKAPLSAPKKGGV